MSKYPVGTYVEVKRKGNWTAKEYFPKEVYRITTSNCEVMTYDMGGTSIPKSGGYVTKKHICNGELISSSYNKAVGEWVVLRKKDLKVLESYDNVVGKELSKEARIE